MCVYEREREREREREITLDQYYLLQTCMIANEKDK